MYKNSSFDFFGVEMLKIKTDNRVNLLSDSFFWNYTDFTLFGCKLLNFVHYYESKDVANDHCLGLNWSTDYSVWLNVADLFI